MFTKNSGPPCLPALCATVVAIFEFWAGGWDMVVEAGTLGQAWRPKILYEALKTHTQPLVYDRWIIIVILFHFYTFRYLNAYWNIWSQLYIIPCTWTITTKVIISNIYRDSVKFSFTLFGWQLNHVCLSISLIMI
jgi:hypothetical protein